MGNFISHLKFENTLRKSLSAFRCLLCFSYDDMTVKITINDHLITYFFRNSKFLSSLTKENQNKAEIEPIE